MSDKTAEELQDELTSMTIIAGEWEKKCEGLEEAQKYYKVMHDRSRKMAWRYQGMEDRNGHPVDAVLCLGEKYTTLLAEMKGLEEKWARALMGAERLQAVSDESRTGGTDGETDQQFFDRIGLIALAEIRHFLSTALPPTGKGGVE